MGGSLPFAGAISDDAQIIASEAATLYQSGERWHTAQANGFRIVRERFDSDTHNQQLLNRVAQLLNQIDEHRLQNFTGAMLRHHQHKSTQYMSQWIEVKSRLNESSDDI